MTHLLEDNRIQDSTYVGFLWIFIVGLRAASTCVGVLTHVCILVEFDIVLSVKLNVFTCDIYLYSGKVNIVVHMLSSRILECLLLLLHWASSRLDCNAFIQRWFSFRTVPLCKESIAKCLSIFLEAPCKEDTKCGNFNICDGILYFICCW